MNNYILITGGTKGIGYAIAEILANSGYDLLLTYSSDQQQAITTQAELRDKYAVKVDVLQADISEKASIDKIASYLDTRDIHPFSVVFNAGLTCRTPFEEMTLDEWERVFFANVHFPVFLLQRICSKLQSGGNVVFTGSLMGEYAHSVSLAYGVTKSAVHSLVKNLVKFMQPYGIRVNAVAPGFVDTEWQKSKPAEIRKSIESKIALGRFCSPEELSEIYKLIIENNYFNGEVITMSGGYSFR
ncbi:MAG TPA: SDR family oxidoreductase [Paludibacteraceae bacterium]|nr:SDR family oxidoreductase [Paludibacteraceae bacterium]